MKQLYSTKVHVSGGRDGRATSEDGRFDIALAMPKALGGSGEGLNPEQLFAAGYGACFTSSIRFAAKGLGLDAGAVTVQATATLVAADDGAFLIEAELDVSAPGLTGAERDAVLAEAKRICAYSNATRGNVSTRITLRD